ncbi:MAG: bifunctional 3-deoxy-7-phosphoheptulonate synthase/chorismate mutase type II [Bacteroidetes bacterium]|nr:bifunctional 3-deoxy-7-phosphoheptulonate synthase/chorismate mutase type II [Bacteroidota bacterium]
METITDSRPQSLWNQKRDRRPVIIAGPCSAETEEQVLETARQLSGFGIRIFRAGIWKPRTRPDSFEGVGNAGLKWLLQAKKETGMLISTEVANGRHAYEAIKFGVDILWIGARTTANPFAVQEIADALQGASCSVLVKNPVNPDTDLWVGAVERLGKAGIYDIGAIHRGFSKYTKERFRNPPIWQIPIELKRRIPEIPMFCDPSHIAGDRSLLPELCQKAIDLDYDGLMIESHENPAKALSDARQQLTPYELDKMLAALSYRKPDSKSAGFLTTIEELRSRIDLLDEDLLNILSERMLVAEQIGKCKKENSVTILQRQRWDDLVKNRIESAIRKGLSVTLATGIMDAIHQESINRQTEVMNSY